MVLIKTGDLDREPINDNENEIRDIMKEREQKAKKSKNPHDRMKWIEAGVLQKRLEEK